MASRLLQILIYLLFKNFEPSLNLQVTNPGEAGIYSVCLCLFSPSCTCYQNIPSRASLVAQRLKRLPALQETWIQSLGPEDPLEKEMETHSNILAWRIPWTEEPGGLQSTGWQRVGHN